MGKEFTKSDKFIYVLNYVWGLGWLLVFIFGTIYNLSNDVSDQTWMSFWKYYIFLNLLASIGCIIWFTYGGFKDLGVMMKKLSNDDRDHTDDGWVEKK